MATSEVIARMIGRLGQSQQDRAAAELDPASAPLEERGPAELIAFLARFAKLVRFYTPKTTGTPPNERMEAVEDGDWSVFFADVAAPGGIERLLASAREDLPPHLALLLAFLDMYEYPRRELNRVTARHLEFFFEQALGFERRAAEPDRAYVLFELKKSAAPVRVRPSDEISAGKDESKREIVFSPSYDAVVGHARVESLRGAFADGDTVRAASAANSADGAGAPLAGAEASWPAFANEAWANAEIGFALASPLLRMREGVCRITVALEDGSRERRPAGDTIARAYLTGEKGWIGPIPARGRNELEMTLDGSQPPIANYDARIHGSDYRTEAPVLRFAFDSASALAISVVERVTLTVSVDGLSALTVMSDLGSHDPSKAFMPFGPQPVTGAHFEVGCDAFAQRLTKIRLRPEWLGAPNLSAHYSAYRYAKNQTRKLEVTLPGAQLGSTPPFEVFAPIDLVLSDDAPSAGRRLAVRLSGDFGHAEYRQLVLEKALPKDPTLEAIDAAGSSGTGAASGGATIQGIAGEIHLLGHELERAFARYLAELREPYTPVIRKLTLGYDAVSSSPEFFHVDCFGATRASVGETPATPLLPPRAHDGELFIGLSGVDAGDSVDLLFQLAEGSADPDAEPATIHWSVLGGDVWRDLGPAEIARDTTNRFRRSGIVGFALPRETTRENSRLPAGLVWLRAALAGDPRAVCDFIAVHANAVEVVYRGPADAQRLAAGALPAGKLSKLRAPLAPVAKLAQPYASFGGRARESQPHFYRRAAERLRHRDRCVTAWDYERLVLEEFPSVHRVKCIPHAKPGAALAPGHVLLVVVPDLRNRNARDALRPRVDADTLSAIAAFVAQRARPGIRVAVRNPSYQEVRLSFDVRFKDGLGFDAYRAILNRELVALLTPWAFDGAADVSFGDSLQRSRLLRFAEQREYVEFVSEFALARVGAQSANEAALRAETPDQIFVSAPAHAIREAPRPQS